MTPITIQHLMSTVRNYLETFGVELSLRRYKLKVKTPRVIRSEKEALTKEDIRCTHSQKLRTYIHFLASTGCRATEALSIRLADINFDKDPVTVFIHGENTKTKVDRVIILISETVEQLKLWIAYKHRTRRVHYYDKQTGLSINEQRTPTIDKQEYIFASKHDHAPR